METETIKTKVVKFGGSSLSDAEHFKKVADIIKADPARRFVVPSAPGKRCSGDDKVTDLLYACYRNIESGNSINGIFSKIEARYNSIIEELGIKLDLYEEFYHIKWAMTHHAGRDYAASRGEYLNGIILAKYLGFDFIDPAYFIKFNDDGTFDAETTNTLLSAELGRHENGVIPGFYGSHPNGTIRTFSRGGSDITGSIVSRAAQADMYENWTDVNGFLMADPHVVDNPKTIKYITYRELRELSYMGVPVLHEDSIFPVKSAGIPINIRNTNDVDDPGTMILSCTDYFDEKNVITGIAGKKGFSVITIEKAMMNAEKGFGRKVLEAIEQSNISFEHIPSGIDSMSVIVSRDELEGKKEKLMNRICALVNPDSISVEDGLALIAVVGRAMVGRMGAAMRIIKSVTEAGVNIRMIDQGSSEFTLILGINEEDFETSIRGIYQEFVK